MFFESWAEVIHMNGHGVYVWWSFGVTLAVVVGLVVEPKLKQRQLKRELKQYYRRQEMRSNNETTSP
ncbi:MAG: heme exporter protein CcmD [Kangiellaceae bacterium]|nr:heme exporter protein CcmD [Kangiellaceae bacterium]|tara:strand:+ start:6273 stop:6473 length:201 start_codon:yes stop_codon:yes gene_type:complete